jgi:Kef-type K+ transport system membrane component KefB
MSLLVTGLFLLTLWISSYVFAFIYSSFLGELLVGILFGGALNWIEPSTYTSLGEIGLLLLVFEAGFNVNLEALKKVAIRSCIVAILGTIFPILLGISVLQILKFEVSASIVSSLSLASTSIGITTILLQQRNLLDSPLGTLITAAAMLDDVLSLILLSIASNLQHISALSIILPLVASFGTMVVGALIHIAFRKVFPLISTKTTEKHLRSGLLVFMIFYGFGASLLANLIGTSPLLGVFAAGTAFIDNKTAFSVWEEYVTTSRSWLLR